MRHLIPAMALAGALLAQISLFAAGPPDDREAPLRSISIDWKPAATAGHPVTVDVTGLNPAALAAIAKLDQSGMQSLFPVYAEQGPPLMDVGVPPMAGHYVVDQSALRFTPMFTLRDGVRYRAVFKPTELPVAYERTSKPVSAVYQKPVAAAGPATVVSHIFPSADVLPENLLKFYLHFSQPMRRGHIYDHIRLLQENGDPVDLPFLELDEELWDPGLTRLTLLIDPGRIKTGVQPLEDIGPALEQGKSYTLVISRQWRDATGQPLKADFKKAFQVTAPDRHPPDPKKWRVTSPTAGTRDPLAVMFEKPMDHALARRLITVVDDADAVIDGTITLTDEERRWAFEPAQPWTAGTHRLIVQTTIEDLAGNNIGKPFEVDLFETVERTLPMTVIELSFEVQPRR